jgi:deferrochelatase/peroxidase EfeB
MVLETLFPDTLDAPDLTDIQAMVIRFYRLNFAQYIFLHFDSAEAGRLWIAWITPSITSAEDWDRQATRYTWNAGFTYPGLQTLGLTDKTLNTFAAEFREGMAPRAEFLGDVGASAPEHWQFGAGTGDQAIHALLILYAEDDAVRDQQEAWLEEGLRAVPGVHILYTPDAELRPGGREHFGYRDGIAQPAIENSGVAPLPGQGPAVRTGEFILGYPDETNMALP